MTVTEMTSRISPIMVLESISNGKKSDTPSPEQKDKQLEKQEVQLLGFPTTSTSHCADVERPTRDSTISHGGGGGGRESAMTGMSIRVSPAPSPCDTTTTPLTSRMSGRTGQRRTTEMSRPSSLPTPMIIKQDCSTEVKGKPPWCMVSCWNNSDPERNLSRRCCCCSSNMGGGNPDNRPQSEGPSTITMGLLTTSGFVWAPETAPTVSRKRRTKVFNTDNDFTPVDARIPEVLQCSRLYIRRNALADPEQMVMPQELRERIEIEVNERKTSVSRKISQYFKAMYSSDAEVDLI